MKKQSGFTLVLLIFILTALSILMLNIYRRSSLLLQGVVEHAYDVRQRYACEALMHYALYMAKYNWDYLIQLTKHGEQSVHSFEWDIVPEKKGDATVTYKAAATKGRLVVAVSLQPDRGRLITISCEITATPEGQVMIKAWKHG